MHSVIRETSRCRHEIQYGVLSETHTAVCDPCLDAWRGDIVSLVLTNLSARITTQQLACYRVIRGLIAG